MRYMGDDSEATNLHYAVPLVTAKKHKRFVKKHEIAVVGYFKKENDLHHKIFCESIWSLHQATDQDDIGASAAVVTLQSVAKKFEAQVPSIVVYLDGKAVEEDGVFAGEKWKVKTVTEFLRQYLPLGDGDEGIREDL